VDVVGSVDSADGRLGPTILYDPLRRLKAESFKRVS